MYPSHRNLTSFSKSNLAVAYLIHVVTSGDVGSSCVLCGKQHDLNSVNFNIQAPACEETSKILITIYSVCVCMY